MQADTHLLCSTKHINSPQILEEKRKARKNQLQKKLQNTSITEQQRQQRKKLKKKKEYTIC